MITYTSVTDLDTNVTRMYNPFKEMTSLFKLSVLMCTYLLSHGCRIGNDNTYT